MSDPYANQYPPPATEMHNGKTHDQYGQSYVGHQPPHSHQDDSSYYTSPAPVYQQTPHAAVPMQERYDGGYYADPGYHQPAVVDQYHTPSPQQHHRPAPAHDDGYYQNAQYYEEPEYVTSPKAPMMQKNGGVGPTMAPENEAESYRPKTYKRHEDSAAGIALIVAAQVIQGKCEDKCGELPEQLSDAAETCGTICGKVVHDGMFYSGIGVTALAGLAVVWRLVMWTCAGCSKH
ncbi:hypothetical protein K492DRAFT_200381 [Lichtheimia hyalospora FSU 10163]|nr:hypothetical protein K492DRAFT_200381 [Lichtheimia hyalospora FSU 10163]